MCHNDEDHIHCQSWDECCCCLHQLCQSSWYQIIRTLIPKVTVYVVLSVRKQNCSNMGIQITKRNSTFVLTTRYDRTKVHMQETSSTHLCNEDDSECLKEGCSIHVDCSPQWEHEACHRLTDAMLSGTAQRDRQCGYAGVCAKDCD